MATVDTILEKIDGIKNSKENIVSVLKEGGVVVPDNTQLSAIPEYIKKVSYSGDLPAHEATIADSTTYGHVRLASDMNDTGGGVVPSIEQLNTLLSNKADYVPLSGGTMRGTLFIDTSNVIDRPALDLKIHTNQDDPYRSLIVIRDETGTEFASIKAKRAEGAAAYKGQIYIISEFLSTNLLNTSKGFYGHAGVAPTTGTWVDAGGAWKFDLIKGEIAITNNGWDSDENAMPASTTFIKFTDIASKNDLSRALGDKQNTLTAGLGIVIEDNIIKLDGYKASVILQDNDSVLFQFDGTGGGNISIAKNDNDSIILAWGYRYPKNVGGGGSLTVEGFNDQATLATKDYVDGLIGDIKTALAAL